MSYHVGSSCVVSYLVIACHAKYVVFNVFCCCVIELCCVVWCGVVWCGVVLSFEVL